MRALIISLTLVLWSNQALSEPEIRPFTATFVTQWNGMVISSTNKLQALSDTQFKQTFKIDTLFADRKEVSYFSKHNGVIRPLTHSLHHGLFGRDTETNTTFDWVKRQAFYFGKKNKRRQTSIENGMQDVLTYQFALRDDIKKGKTNLHYRVVKRGRVRNYTFHRIGEETINVPFGEVKTLKVERTRRDDESRKTVFWLAKELDYFPVKIKQTEEDGKLYMIQLKALVFQ